MRACKGYCTECHQACTVSDDSLEILRLRKMIEALGEALGDMICETTSPDRYVELTGGVRVPPSWGHAMRIHDEVYAPWIDEQGD